MPFNVLNLVWHNYNTTLLSFYQYKFLKTARCINKNCHFCDGNNYFILFALCFAVLIDEISITRIFVHIEPRYL